MDKRSLGRKNPIVFSAWSSDEINEFWEKHITNESTIRQSNQTSYSPFEDCIMWNKSFQNGYPAVSMGHAKSKIKMHIMSAYRKHRAFPKQNEVISHLCHRKACINPDHLVIESINLNNRRIGCVCIAQVPTTKYAVNVCPHIPRCLTRDTANIRDDFVPTLLK